MSKVLVLTPDVIKTRLAGPAIRAWEISKELAKSNAVRLVSASKVAVERSSVDFEVMNFHRSSDLRAEFRWADVVIVQGAITSRYPWMLRDAKHLVTDLYDPMHLEALEQTEHLPPKRRVAMLRAITDTLNTQIDSADLILCASPKQRDFWLGQLAARGRINPLTYALDGRLDRLLQIVPFGLDTASAVQSGSAIRGVIRGIGPEDEVLIWGGGLYNWLDPLSLIRSMSEVIRVRPNVKLFFMGSGHPNPNVPQMRIAQEARELASELGLLDSAVFFNDEWVTYEDRVNYLMDADIGVSTHKLHLETEFSFRTRILDYLWAGLPMVVSDGDGFAEVIRKSQLGIVVEPENVALLSSAIIALLEDAKFRRSCRENVRLLSREFEWTSVLQPLSRYCENPWKAADRLDRSSRSPLRNAWASSARHNKWGQPLMLLSRIRYRILRKLNNTN